MSKAVLPLHNIILGKLTTSRIVIKVVSVVAQAVLPIGSSSITTRQRKVLEVRGYRVVFEECTLLDLSHC